MPLTKATGQMYDWVTHCHSILRGECPHGCSYCYVKIMAQRWAAVHKHHSGDLRLAEEELQVSYKPGRGRTRTIFIEHLNDLWAEAVPDEWIFRVLDNCRRYPENAYIFQTKNPARYLSFLDAFPPAPILGTTIESNRTFPNIMRDAPSIPVRYKAMQQLRKMRPMVCTFVTVEPILKFDRDELANILIDIAPCSINIGADSKAQKLPEPSAEDVAWLIQQLTNAGTRVRQKSNLKRLLIP